MPDYDYDTCLSTFTHKNMFLGEAASESTQGIFVGASMSASAVVRLLMRHNQTQELRVLKIQTSATHHKQNATTTKPTCLLPRLWVVPSDPAAPFRNTDEKNFESLGLATMLPVCTEAWSLASPQTSRTLDSAETLWSHDALPKHDRATETQLRLQIADDACLARQGAPSTPLHCCPNSHPRPSGNCAARVTSMHMFLLRQAFKHNISFTCCLIKFA